MEGETDLLEELFGIEGSSEDDYAPCVNSERAHTSLRDAIATMLAVHPLQAGPVLATKFAQDHWKVTYPELLAYLEKPDFDIPFYPSFEFPTESAAFEFLHGLIGFPSDKTNQILAFLALSSGIHLNFITNVGDSMQTFSFGDGSPLALTLQHQRSQYYVYGMEESAGSPQIEPQWSPQQEAQEVPRTELKLVNQPQSYQITGYTVQPPLEVVLVNSSRSSDAIDQFVTVALVNSEGVEIASGVQGNAKALDHCNRVVFKHLLFAKMQTIKAVSNESFSLRLRWGRVAVTSESFKLVSKRNRIPAAIRDQVRPMMKKTKTLKK